MAAKILDGKALAEQIKGQLKQRVTALGQKGRTAKLVAILVGGDASAELYATRQGETCRDVGIQYELLTLPAGSTMEQVVAVIDNLNADPAISGLMLHMPVPGHLDSVALQQGIAPAKDVEGVNPANLGFLLMGKPVNIPCTAAAAYELVKASGVTIRGAQAVVIGASEIVGKPVALLLSDDRATVEICRSATADLAEHTRRAKILVVAVGKPNMIGADHIGEGAVVVDVGINRITLPDGSKKTVGDVAFAAARDKAGWITPVPGGVGPMTVAMLLRNTVAAAER